MAKTKMVTNLEVENVLGITLKKFDEKKGFIEIAKADFRDEFEALLREIGLRRAKEEVADAIQFKVIGKIQLQKIRLEPGWKENRKLSAI